MTMPNAAISRSFGRLACLLSALILGACDMAPDSEEELLRPVRYLTIADNVAGRDRTFSGSLKSIRESRLSFKVAGTVTDVPVQIGQRVNRGDLIAEHGGHQGDGHADDPVDVAPASRLLVTQSAETQYEENRRADI